MPSSNSAPNALIVVPQAGLNDAQCVPTPEFMRRRPDLRLAYRQLEHAIAAGTCGFSPSAVETAPTTDRHLAVTSANTNPSNAPIGTPMASTTIVASRQSCSHPRAMPIPNHEPSTTAPISAPAANRFLDAVGGENGTLVS